MGVLDWIILAVVVILAVLAVRRIRKKGNGCGCGCADCPSKNGCQKPKEGKIPSKQLQSEQKTD